MPPRKSKDAKAEKEKPKRHTWDQRKGDFANVPVYRDVAEWLKAIAEYATRELKRKGKISGHDKISMARVIDPLVREVCHATWWRVRCAEMGIDQPIPETPDPPEPPLDLELPE